MHPFLRVIFKVQTTHPLLTLLVALVLAVLSTAYTIRSLEFQTSQKDLIYPDNRLMQLSERRSQFENLDSFVVAIQSPDQSHSLQFLHALVERLEQDKTNYRQLLYRVDPHQLRAWALLYLSKKTVSCYQQSIRKKLSLKNSTELVQHAVHWAATTTVSERKRQMSSRL